MNIISRKHYIDKIEHWLGRQQIIVLIGQRRAGKSFILKDFINLHKADDSSNIIYVNKEKSQFDHIRTHSDLNGYIESSFLKDKHNYILIDEVQEIQEWEKTVRSYQTEGNTDIIITGSNSKMLSGELSTLIGGRYQEILVQSLTYNEFLKFHNLEDTDDSLWTYLNFGGLPGLVQTGIDDEDLISEYLNGVFNTIMLKDIIERHSIRNIAFLNNLIRFFADTVGKLSSISNICGYLKGQGQDVSTKTVSAYLDYFSEAYLISPVHRFDIHGKKILESNDKVYFGDIGLRNIIAGGERDSDIEKIIENAVYLHLVNLGYKVSVGQLRVGEVDFICTRTNDRRYVQVAYIINNEETVVREFGRLQNINDNYPKYVISMTPLVRRSDYEGIIHIGLREFLKNGFGR